MYHAQQLSKTAIKIRHSKVGFEAFCEAKMKIRGFALILTFGCLTVARGGIQAAWGFGWQLGHASPATTANMYADISFEDKNPCSIVTVWPELPKHIKAAIKVLVQTYKPEKK